MGGNVCKELGISPTKTIGSNDLDKIWEGYTKKSKNEAPKLGKRDAQKFLKHFAQAIGVQYTKSRAERWFNAVDKEKKGEITYENFKELFLQAITEGITANKPRVNLSDTLAGKLNLDTDPGNVIKPHIKDEPEIKETPPLRDICSYGPPSVFQEPLHIIEQPVVDYGPPSHFNEILDISLLDDEPVVKVDFSEYLLSPPEVNGQASSDSDS